MCALVLHYYYFILVLLCVGFILSELYVKTCFVFIILHDVAMTGGNDSDLVLINTTWASVTS